MYLQDDIFTSKLQCEKKKKLKSSRTKFFQDRKKKKKIMGDFALWHDGINWHMEQVCRPD